MPKKISKHERFFTLRDTLETLLLSHRVLWETEERNFTLTCYQYGDGAVMISQNFHGGEGIFTYIQTRGAKWDDVALAIARSLTIPDPVS